MPKLTMVGTVVSNAMQKTIRVNVVQWKVQRKINLTYKATKNFMAHDEQEVCRVGDQVRIIECRPLSKNKHFMLDEVVHKNPRATDQKISIKTRHHPVTPLRKH